MNASELKTAEQNTAEQEPDDYLTEEERAAIEEQEDEFDAQEEEHRLSLFARGCLEVAGVFAGLAALVLILGQVGICIGCGLGQLVVPLTLAAGSLLALTTCLFSSFHKALGGAALVVTIWFIILVYGITNFQFPEVIETTLPHTGEKVVLTQITTPIGATLCVDDILIPGAVSKRFKMPVHPKYIPFGYQVRLDWNEEFERVDLYYNEKIWAVYDPERKRWENAAGKEGVIETTEPETKNTMPQHRKK